MKKKTLCTIIIILIAMTLFGCEQKEKLYGENELNISFDISNNVVDMSAGDERSSNITFEIRGALEENVYIGKFKGHFQEIKDEEKDELIKKNREIENSILVIASHETDYGEIIWIDKDEAQNLVVKKRYFTLGYHPGIDDNDSYIDELYRVDIPEIVTTITFDKRENPIKEKGKIIKEEYAYLGSAYFEKIILEDDEDTGSKEEIIQLPEYQSTPSGVVLEYLSLKKMEDFQSQIVTRRLEQITSEKLNLKEILDLSSKFKLYMKYGYASVDEEIVGNKAVVTITYGDYCKDYYIEKKEEFTLINEEYWTIANLDCYQEEKQYSNGENRISKYDSEDIEFYLNFKRDLDQYEELIKYKNTLAEDDETVNNLFRNIVPNGLTFEEVKRNQRIVNLKERTDIFRVYYTDNCRDADDEYLDMRDVFKTSAVLLSLINDVDGIRTTVSLDEGSYNFLVTREMVEELAGVDLESYMNRSQDFEKFIMKLEELNLENYKYSKEEGEQFTLYSFDIEAYDVYVDGIYFITGDLFESVIDIIKYEHGIYIDDIKFEGEVLMVNLNKEMEFDFDMGSTGATALDNELKYNVLNIKDANKIKILVDGEEDVFGNHFSFEGYVDQEHYKISDDY